MVQILKNRTLPKAGAFYHLRKLHEEFHYWTLQGYPILSQIIKRSKSRCRFEKTCLAQRAQIEQKEISFPWFGLNANLHKQRQIPKRPSTPRYSTLSTLHPALCLWIFRKCFWALRSVCLYSCYQIIRRSCYFQIKLKKKSHPRLPL